MKILSFLIVSIVAVPQFCLADDAATRPDTPALAKSFVEQAMSIYRHFDDMNRSGHFTYNLYHQFELATSLLSISDINDAESLLRRQQDFIKMQTDPREVERESNQIQLARIEGYALAGNWQKAEELIALVPPPKDLNYGDYRGAAVGTLGWAAAKRGYNQEAIEFYKIAFEYTMSHPAYSEELKALDLADGLAPAQYALGEKADAEKTFRAAIKIGMSDSRPDRRAGSRADLVESLAKLGELDMAREVISLAADTSEQHFLWRWFVKSLAQSGQLDDALSACNTHDFLWSDCENCEVMADAYSKAGKPEEAKKFLGKAETAWAQIDQTETRITRATEIGQSYGLAGDKDSARKWFKIASDLIMNTTIPESGPLAKAMPVDKTIGSNARMNLLRALAVTESKYGFADQARQDLQNALVAAHGEQPGMWSGVSINAVAKSQAMAGFPDDAIDTMNREGFSDTASLVWPEIMLAYGRAGKIDRAVEIGTTKCATLEPLAQQYLRGGDLDNALKVGLLLKGMEFVMHDVGYAYARRGDVKPILAAADREDVDPNIRIALLIGASDGLLDVVPDPSVIQPQPTTRPMPVYAQ